MIGYRVLGKSKSKTALLVHGLFSSAGFWLPYLGSFKDFRLLVVDIDYKKICDLEGYADCPRRVIDSESSGCADVVVAHSLGTVLVNGITPKYYKSIFNICPVYCAKRINTDKFIDQIKFRLENAVTKNEIIETLKKVDSALRSYRGQPSETSEPTVYIPNSDLYFSYESNSKYKFFQGDHFDISLAVRDIESTLARI